MRFLVKVTIPKKRGKETSKREELPQTMQAAMQRLKPEAAYFFEEEGNHQCVFVFNLDVPSLLKPLFPNLEPSFQVTPVMTAAEFEHALGAEVGKQPPAQKPDLETDLHPPARARAWDQPEGAKPGRIEPLPSRPDDVPKVRPS